MILVTGGIYQGKCEIAKAMYQQKRKKTADRELVLADESCNDAQKLLYADVILQFHLWIRRWMEEHKDPYAMTKHLVQENADVIITLAQVGCGIVPMEAFDREYRETVGSIGCLLADKAQEVYMVHCGIAQQIK